MYVGWCESCGSTWVVARDKAQDTRKVGCPDDKTRLFVYVPSTWTNDDPPASCNKGLAVPFTPKLPKGKDAHNLFQWEDNHNGTATDVSNTS